MKPMPRDRMFNVLVLGGIALVAGSACGSGAAVHVDAGSEDGGLPSEPRERADASVVDTGSGFPSEPPAPGTDAAARDAAVDGFSFPMEVQ